MKNKRIQVFEYDILQVDADMFTKEHFNALVKFNQRNGDRIFTVRHNSLRFGSYVGVIQVGGLTIEILPKTDRKCYIEKTTMKWHCALIDMLQYCGYLKARISTRAGLDVRRASLLDLYLIEFIYEAEKVFMYGLARTYRRDQDNLYSLKGRLILGKQISRNLVHNERFFVEFDRYDQNSTINQILKRALKIIFATTKNWTIRDRALFLSHYLEAVSEVVIDEDTFNRLEYTRNTERYRNAISLAYLIVMNYQPDTRSGRHDVLAILFDMNVLYEKYVFRRVLRAASDMSCGITVTGQNRYLFWRRTAGEGKKEIRPDIEVRVDGQRPVVIDTKWKQPGLSPSDADLKQMYAYSKLLHVNKSILVYPRTDDRLDIEGEFITHLDKITKPTTKSNDYNKVECSMRFIELFGSDNRLSDNIGADILRYAIPNPTVHDNQDIL